VCRWKIDGDRLTKDRCGRRMESMLREIDSENDRGSESEPVKGSAAACRWKRNERGFIRLVNEHRSTSEDPCGYDEWMPMDERVDVDDRYGG